MRQYNTVVPEGGGVMEWRPPPAVGDAVCVRTGTPDPDFPDMQLDDWTGVLIARNEAVYPARCLVQWDEDTLDGMSADQRDRCEMEDFALDQMWLSEDDLDVLPECDGVACGVDRTSFTTNERFPIL